jgi:hypothetical protein
MLYDVALLPQLFDVEFHEANPARSARLETILREMAENGTLADLNKSACSKEIFNRIEKLPEPVRTDLKRGLILLRDRNRLARRPKVTTDIDSKHSWLELALSDDTIDDIIVDYVSATRDSRLSELDRVFDSDAWNKRSRTWGFTMDEAGYRKVLTPLLRYATKLVLVDPHLNADPSYKPFIKMCAQLLGSRRSNQSGYIEFHSVTRDHHGSEKNLQQWHAYLTGLKAHWAHEYKVCLYEKPKEGQRFHDRYVLTNQCGVSVPYGFQIVRGNQTDWTLLDYRSANARRAEYERHTHLSLAKLINNSLVV